MSAKFELDLNKLTWATGETVKGKLIFEPSTDRKIHGVHIQFYGREFCEYSIWHDIPFKKKWVVDGLTTVWGNKVVRRDPTLKNVNEKYNEDDCKLMTSGKYSWPFTFKIPKNIPPSCEFRKGKLKVEYMLLAFITVPWGRSMTVKKFLTIGSCAVPGIDPERPLNMAKKDKTYHLASDPSGVGKANIEVEAFTEQNVTFPGGKIGVHVKLHNGSGRTVNHLKVKLKRVLTFGTSTEKETVMKFKHLDKQFPLGTCTYHGFIPLVIPGAKVLDKKPSVTNASLCKVHYYVSVRAKLNVGQSIRVRAPITICSFPPEEKKAPEVPETKEEKEERERLYDIYESGDMGHLIDFDGPLDNNHLDEPIQPMAVVPYTPREDQESDDEDEEPRKFSYEDEFNRIQEAIRQLITEHDTLSQWSQSGILAEAIDLPSGVTIGSASNELMNALTRVQDSLQNLLDAARNRDEEDYIQALREDFAHLCNLSQQSRFTAAQVPHVGVQQTILQQAKTVLISTQQSMIASREALLYDPFASNYTTDYMQQVLDLAVKSVVESARDLVESSSMAKSAVNTRADSVEQARSAVEQSLVQFANPFSEMMPTGPVSAASLNKAAQELAETSIEFVRNCYGAGEGQENNEAQLATKVNNFLQTAKGVAITNPMIGGPIADISRRTGQAIHTLLGLISVMHKSGRTESNDELINRSIHEVTTGAFHLADVLSHMPAPQPVYSAPISAPMNSHPAPMNSYPAPMATHQVPMPSQTCSAPAPMMSQQQVQSPVRDLSIEENAESELSAISNMIAKQAQAVVQMRSPAPSAASSLFDDLVPQMKNTTISSNNASNDLTNSVGRVTSAISDLLKASHLAQQERLTNAKNNEMYFPMERDSTYTQKFVEKAREINQLVADLTSAMSDPNVQEENIVSLIRAVSAATAHLISAYRAKADVNSQTYQQVLHSARVVTTLISDMLSSMPEKKTQVHSLESTSDASGPMRFRDELEAQSKIAKLEKQLQEARGELTTMRKTQYNTVL